MLKNGQTYFKTPQDFKSVIGHFSTLCKKDFTSLNDKYYYFCVTIWFFRDGGPYHTETSRLKCK